MKITWLKLWFIYHGHLKHNLSLISVCLICVRFGLRLQRLLQFLSICVVKGFALAEMLRQRALRNQMHNVERTGVQWWPLVVLFAFDQMVRHPMALNLVQRVVRAYHEIHFRVRFWNELVSKLKWKKTKEKVYEKSGLSMWQPMKNRQLKYAMNLLFKAWTKSTGNRFSKTIFTGHKIAYLLERNFK